MNPIAFSLFGIDIRWYGIIISSGMILALLIAKYTCKIKEANYDTMIDLALISLPFSIVGARLYYVLFNLNYYKEHVNEIINIRQGGMAIHGGVIFAFLAAYIYARKKKLNFLKYADAASPTIIIAQAIGRWGNFFNQEAHGGEVTYQFIQRFPKFIQEGMHIDGTYYHPTFLYESIWDFLMFFVLIYILKKSKKDGITLFSYIGLYSLGRFFIEGLRTDSLMIGPLRMAQLVSLSGIVIWLFFLYIAHSKKR